MVWLGTRLTVKVEQKQASQVAHQMAPISVTYSPQKSHKLSEIFSQLLYTYTHTHPFNSPLSRTTWVSWYQKGKTNLVFTEASGICWTICKSAPRSNQITTPVPHHSVFLLAGCPSCRPTNSVKAPTPTLENIAVAYMSKDYTGIKNPHTCNAEQSRESYNSCK